MDFFDLVLTAGGGILAGLVGALMGLGGGLIAVPFLNLGLGLPIHEAAAAGLVSTLVVSCTAAGRYLRQGGLVDVYRALEIELAAAAGGLAGGFVAGWLGGGIIQGLFALVMLYAGVQVVRSSSRPERPEAACRDLARWRRCLAGCLCFLAGMLSGLLGIGGGVILVPILHLVLCMRFKSAAATSNFMMGMTAVPALCGFVARSELVLAVSIPLALGVLAGASIGAWLMPRLRASWLKITFALLLFATAVEMAARALEAW
ncbi:MAG: sulfite exporter TauE/SafE family protein [Deltaproteobacteria bacterium]|nr:sulfite exporter TauE/SafE family protein [Deltaproteobacteria bacterium]